MAHFIVVYSSPDGGERRFELDRNGSYRVGSRSDNDIVIAQKDVSRHHAILRAVNGSFHITDLKSKNGTFINGHRTVAASLRCGDLINVSSARLVVVEVSSGSYAQIPALPGTTGGLSSSNGVDSVEDTVKRAHGATLDDLVGLLELTAEAVRGGRLADPLTWAVEHFGFEAAMVLGRDAKGRVGVVTSAGDLGPVVQRSSVLCGLVGEARTRGADNPTVSLVEELGDDLLVAFLRGDHVLVMRHEGAMPAIGDVRALVAAMETVLLVGADATASGVLGPVSRLQRTVVHDPIKRLCGVSSVIEELRLQAVELAGRSEPLLVVGEPGVGKSLFARTIHELSSRQNRPFIILACREVAQEEVEEVLFGRSDSGGRGKVGAAEGGTLFLRDVDRLPRGAQERLAAEVRDCRARDPGGRGRASRNLRVVASTTKDLEAEIRESRFRQDLYLQLRALRVEVAPLRNRTEDIPLLVDRFLDQGCQEIGKMIRGLTVESHDALMGHGWPGNVAELRDAVMKIVAATDDGKMAELDSLPEGLRRSFIGRLKGLDPQQLMEMTLAEARDAVDSWKVSQALGECGGDRARVAKRLGLSRSGLARLLRRMKSPS